MRTGLVVLVVAVGAFTVLGLVALWPRGSAPDLGAQPNEYVDATVRSLEENATCPGIEYSEPTPCTVYDVELTSGPDKGDTIDLSVRMTQVEVPNLDVDDRIVLRDTPASPAGFRYSFYDFQRGTALLWLVAAFVVVVLVFGRFQGVRALAGLGLSLAVLVVFLVPALLRDRPAVAVALVASIAIAYLAIYLAHGVRLASTIALAGTLVSLAFTCALAIGVAWVTHLSGLASQEAQTLRMTADALDLRGLLIAGIVVGALGVIDDLTVSQVSTVMALRRANPSMSARALYSAATKVGRDHVASAVNTLVLAYAGASLPLLLFFTQGNQPAGRLLTGELVAVEIIRMLVGSIGLVLSVPITTRLAAIVLSRSDVPDDDSHDGHVHGDLDALDLLDDDLVDDVPPPRAREPEPHAEPWF